MGPVVSAGHKQRGDETVYCPAQVDDCLAVGGFVAECTAGRRTKPAPGILGPEIRPPGAYWIEKWSDVDYPEQIPDTSFCSYDQCSDEKACEDYREERPWEYNVQPSNDKPDILGPIHYPHIHPASLLQLDTDTSFAAPVVGGAVAAIFGELFEQGKAPSPAFEVRWAVKTTGTPIGATGEFRKFHSQRTCAILAP